MQTSVVFSPVAFGNRPSITARRACTLSLSRMRRPAGRRQIKQNETLRDSLSRNGCRGHFTRGMRHRLSWANRRKRERGVVFIVPATNGSRFFHSSALKNVAIKSCLVKPRFKIARQLDQYENSRTKNGQRPAYIKELILIPKETQINKFPVEQ